MPHTRSAADWEDQARSDYRRGDYTAAIESVENAIRATPKPSVSQLELRIASKEKLGDLTTALALTKSLVSTYPAEANGYVRGERLLQKLKRPEQALKLCERGLRAMRPEHTGYEVLKEKYRKLQQSLELDAQTRILTKAADPFKTLPLEMIQQVLSELSFSQRLPLMRVSKSWQKVLHQLPSLWRDLDLSRARRKVSSKFINKCFNLSYHSIEKAIIGNVENLESVVVALTKNCHDLTSLAVHEARPSQSLLDSLALATNLTSLAITPVQVRGDDVKRLLARCPNLISFECTGLDNDSPHSTWRCLPKGLESLFLEPRKSNGIHFLKIDSIIEFGPNLTHLDVGQFNSIIPQTTAARPLLDFSQTKLEFLSVMEDGRPMSLPRTLKSWQTVRRIDSRPQVPGASYFVPNLERVSCETLRCLQSLIEDPTDPCDNRPIPLVSVNISAAQEGAEVFARIMRTPDSRLPKLQDLVLNQARNTDDVFVPIIAQIKSLRHIDLSYSDLTGYGVKQLITSLPLLKRVYLDGCREVSVDTFAWAREKNVAIIGSTEWEDGKAKKVRYGF